MKKIMFALCALLLAGFLGSCAGSPADNGTLKAAVTIYPLYDFAQKIAGGKADITLLVPAGTEPHDWEPTAADMKTLEKSDLFIYNGAGMEHWVTDALKSLGNKDLAAVEASAGISLLEGGDAHEEEEEGHEEEEEEEGHDPHVWLAPQNAKKQLHTVCEAFVKADPANKDYYRSNYEKYAAEADKLDGEYKAAAAAAAKTRDIVVSHQAFGYLCAAYGLRQVPVEGLYADSEPSPARMAEIIDFVKQNNVKVIFCEELISRKTVETIARETGAAVEVLNPLEGLTDAQIEDGEDYFSVMRKNLAAIKKALE